MDARTRRRFAKKRESESHIPGNVMIRTSSRRADGHVVDGETITAGRVQGRMASAIDRFAETVAWGVTRKDRALIAAYYGLLLSSKFLRPSEAVRQGMHPAFWLGDVRVSTPAGEFQCRGRTTDFDIVNPRFEGVLLRVIGDRLSVLSDHPPIFVDVGAHIGKHTIPAGRLLRDIGRVIAIEPDPDNFRALQANVQLNNLSNVDLRNLGAWSEGGELALHRGTGNLGEHSFIDEVGSESVSVPVRTLDSLLSDLGVAAVDVIKIDAQRAEAHVLKGASRMLAESSGVSVIFEETDPPETAESMRLLRSYDFKIKRLDAFNYIAER